MTKSLIDTASEAIQDNYKRRRYGARSLAEGYIAALDYANTCHFDVPQYEPVFGPIAERLKASGDLSAWRTFTTTHRSELIAEERAAFLWQNQREWAKGEPAEVIIARNQAAVAADKLELEIRERAAGILRERELAAAKSARAEALAEARKQVTP